MLWKAAKTKVHVLKVRTQMPKDFRTSQLWRKYGGVDGDERIKRKERNSNYTSQHLKAPAVFSGNTIFFLAASLCNRSNMYVGLVFFDGRLYRSDIRVKVG